MFLFSLLKVSIYLSVSVLTYETAKRVSISLHVSCLCFNLWNTARKKREKKSAPLSCSCFLIWNTAERVSISVWVVCIFIYEKLCISLCELLVFSPMKPFKRVSISMWVLLCFLLWNSLNCQWLCVFSYGMELSELSVASHVTCFKRVSTSVWVVSVFAYDTLHHSDFIFLFQNCPQNSSVP